MPLALPARKVTFGADRESGIWHLAFKEEESDNGSMRRACALALCWLTLLAGSAIAASGKRLAVLELRGRKLDNEALRALSDAVRGGTLEVAKGRGLTVMTRETLLVLLKEKGKAGCSEGDLDMETARKIGADYLVSGEVTTLEGSYVVTLKMHQVSNGSLLGSSMTQGKSQLQLLETLRAGGAKLVTDTLPTEASGSEAPTQRPASAQPDFDSGQMDPITGKPTLDPVRIRTIGSFMPDEVAWSANRAGTQYRDGSRNGRSPNYYNPSSSSSSKPKTVIRYDESGKPVLRSESGGSPSAAPPIRPSSPSAGSSQSR
jgi:hypothetical protein